MPLTEIPFISNLLSPFRKKREAAIRSYAWILNNYFPYYKRLNAEAAHEFAERGFPFPEIEKIPFS